MSRSKNWCFTLNSPDAEKVTRLRLKLAGRGVGHMTYLILQTERGESGTVHIQGYVEFDRRMRLPALRQWLDGAHFEVRRGTAAQASAYCEKEDSRVAGLHGSWGVMKPPRGRPKGQFSEAVMAMADDGMDISEVEDKFPVAYVQFRDRLEDFAIRQKGTRRWAMQVDVFVGVSGVGKSFTADQENPGAYYVPWPTGGRWWWPGYRGEECVIMDEFRHQIKMDVMLKMLDRYDWMLESKGRNFKFVSRKIVITTNIDPKDWYAGVDRDVKEPLRRRIREFCHIYDFAVDGSVEGGFTKDARDMSEFEFNDTVVRDFRARNSQ